MPPRSGRRMRGGEDKTATAAAPPAPAVPGAIVPKAAGTGEPTLNSVTVEKNVAISSKGDTTAGITSGPFKNLGAEIKNINGYDILRFNMEPGASVITNQETMSYMDGGLSTNVTTGSGGLFSAFFRGITGASVLQNSVVNPTSNTLKMTLSPLLQGSIVQIDLQPGETWRFADKSFVAATPNLNVSGNINIFSNFRMMFVGENLTYTTVSANQGTAGSVWVSSYGAVEKHELSMGTGSTVPLFINNGCFLGMMDNNGAINFWSDYVSVGTANGFFQAMFTQLGWIMKIQDTIPPRRPGPVKVTVLTQSLNPHNYEKFIAKIAEKTIEKMGIQTSPSSHAFLSSGVGPRANPAVLGTAAGLGAVGVGAAGLGATAAATGTAALASTNSSSIPTNSSALASSSSANIPTETSSTNSTPATNSSVPAANSQPASDFSAPAANSQPAANYSAPAANTSSSGFGFGSFGTNSGSSGSNSGSSGFSFGSNSSSSSNSGSSSFSFGNSSSSSSSSSNSQPASGGTRKRKYKARRNRTQRRH